METIRCPKCGKDVPWRKFCGFCGSTLPPKPELKLEESELELNKDKKHDNEENKLLNAVDEITKPEFVSSPQPAIKKPKRKQPAKPQSVHKPVSNPKPVDRTVEIAPKEIPTAKKKNGVVIFAVVIAVLVLFVGAGVVFYKNDITGNIQRRVEEVLSFPSKQVVDQLKEEMTRLGCAVKELQIGIKPATKDAINAYKNRTGVVHASGTHMIWIKAKCSKIGVLPIGSEIQAERLETLPAFYNGKYMVFDPVTNSMVKYIPTR